MKKSRIYFLFSLLLMVASSRAQNPDMVRNYVITYKDLAIAEMKRTGVPASVKLAQGIHETSAGTSKLVIKSNNHFGIKCKSNWTGESVKHDDDARGECFRKYATAEDSYKDHSDFLKNSQRYASLFTLDPTDYQGWANGLKNAGYATNPKYPLVLIKLIEEYHLQDYTLIALGKLPEGEIVQVQIDTDDKGASEPKEESGIKNQNYPAGEFKINDTKVIFVKKGTSFISIAQQYDIPLARIFEFNEINQSEISEKDQLVYLQRKRKTGDEEYYIVQLGETLHDIAQAQAMRLESLKEFNWLTGDERPAVGEKLWLKKKSPMAPRLALKENYSLIPGVKSKTTD